MSHHQKETPPKGRCITDHKSGLTAAIPDRFNVGESTAGATRVDIGLVAVCPAQDRLAHFLLADFPLHAGGTAGAGIG